MSKIYRIKTAEEFKAEGRFRPHGAPESWATNGAMNHFMGKTIPESKLKFSSTGNSFNIEGYPWVFSTKDIFEKEVSGGIVDGLLGIRTPVTVSVPATKKKTRGPSKSSITEGTDAYGEKVYIGDTVVYAPNSGTIYRGVVQSFTPKANPRVKIEQYDNYVVACMRPYVKVHIPLNGKRMVDLIHNIK